ncbi:glycoside hydrolase [Armillaria novae-zelandiae]|uniref:Glycoside hydrolase n=1 Tax=Armillaria novae-zelandiae TaxID=153914 RepID=A0AA39PTM3_9AGAR|nr:glycoside hydrolase [Armillaria novae-zelandiae]
MLALNFLLAYLIGLLYTSPTVFGNTSSPIKVLGSRANTLPGPPHFVIYSDIPVPSLIGPPLVALSFLLVSGPVDESKEWTRLTAAQRSTIKAQFAAAGIKLIVSVFGSTDKPTSNRADPIATANTMSEWVKQYDLDGIDVDYEDLKAVDAGDGKAEDWIISFTKQLRRQLPQGQYILTHARQVFFFLREKFCAYRTVHTAVGASIDWYNVQHAEGTTEYTTCTGLLTASSSNWPQTALFQIASNAGVPLSKLVIGKPGTKGDASNGLMSASTLASCLKTAHSQGWNAGVSVWQFPDVAAAWIQAVRALAFPL